MGTTDHPGPAIPRFTLRPATEGDFWFIHTIRAAGLREYVDQIRGWDDAAQLDRFRARFDPAVFAVIVVDDRDVGAMAVEWMRGEAILTDFYITAEWQRQGLGTVVLRSLITEAEPERGAGRAQSA